jgi:hypothetical protein
MKVIASELAVSPASVHLWTADIKLSEAQVARNRKAAGMLRGRTWRALNRERRLRYQAEGRARAGEADPLHQAGCMLYWAEGAKDRNSMVFANSDPHMVAFFVRFLRSCFGVSDADLTMRVNAYTGNGRTIEQIQQFWLTLLNLPPEALRKPIENHFPTSSSGRRKDKLPYGVCAIRVRRSTSLVQHVYGAIQEYAGFEESRWLDGPPARPRGEQSAPDPPGPNPPTSPSEPSARAGGSPPGPRRPSVRRRALPR